MKEAEQELEEAALKKEQEMGMEQLDKSDKPHHLNGYREYIKTLVTFNTLIATI